ncbi:hypothetical protein AK830_g2774 [Neonectria ditissima]|uniref:Zn(2)-C6 fungal-type domain-containing protein n=1 Tax=Neonectria ditissima TaxID=78410 RepID=A0A0P7BRA7_9HYPO|nr:hypothetical protein AK830_g2774 [Neonectria ditissima]
MNDAVPRKARKGTKSCTECRRRKVACSWTSEHDAACRRCEERGSSCVAQVFASPSTSVRRAGTRDRVSRLEQQVARLTKAVYDRETTLEAQGTASPNGRLRDDVVSSDAGTDTESQVSDVPMMEPPSYLNSLFNNNLISSDNQSSDNIQELRARKALAHLADTARAALQPLIPSKEDVAVFAGHASGWQLLLHFVVPVASMSKPGHELLAQYEDMRQPTVDPLSLASWLIAIAITVEQMPREVASGGFTSKWSTNTSRFSTAVAEAVERTIVARETLSGSLEGVETNSLLVRLYHARGNFLKAWLQLRRTIALAELLGFHCATDEERATLWECLCSMDKFNSLLFAFPSATRYYRGKVKPLLINGNPSAPSFVSRLSYIAVELQEVSDRQAKALSDAELYEKISKLDTELREVASSSPEWWAEEQEPVMRGLIMQYFHSYITMRVHAPLSLRPGSSPQASYCRASCTEACSGLIRRYVKLCPMLPSGFFLRRLLDLQVFTAVIILLLVDFSSASAVQSLLPETSSQRAKALAEEVVESMQSTINQPNSDYSKQAIPTILSLIELLNKNDSSQTDGSLSVRVPLLGKVHVRRRQHKSPKSGENSQVNSSIAESTALPAIGEPLSSQYLVSEDPTLWEPLSWSIEDDSERMFHEATMMEYFSPTDTWSGNTALDFTYSQF